MSRQVWLYDEGTAPTLRCDEVARFLMELAPRLDVSCRGDFITHWLASSGESAPTLAAMIARIKVRDPCLALTCPDLSRAQSRERSRRSEACPELAERVEGSAPRESEPLAGEIAYERRRLENANRGPFGIIYDGFRFQELLAELRGRYEGGAVHIAFTNRLLATWEADDRRYHLRTVVLGAPSVISTSGLVEAPAKPREFYMARQALGMGDAAGGAAYEALKQQFAGRFLDHDDERLTEVAKGYALQAVAYHLTSEPFCDNPRCRLYNAHWQEEMLAAQLGGEVCERHRAALREAG